MGKGKTMIFTSLKSNYSLIIFIFVTSIALLSALIADENAKETPKESNDLIECSDCKGVGKNNCTNCVEGKMSCPDRCIKKDLSTRTDKVSKPDYVHITFGDQFGKIIRSSCHPLHIGEIMNVTNGKVEPQGKCKTCSGKAIVECDKCKGTKLVECSKCKSTGKISKKEINEKLKKEAEQRELIAFTLKDGTKYYGKFYAKSETHVIIKDEKDEKVQIKISDLKSVPEKYKSLLLPEEK